MNSTLGAIVGIEPKDELEGMLAAQLHGVSKRSDGVLSARPHRRAISRGLDGDPYAGEQAVAHLSRRSRGPEPPSRKGQQKMTVEHVHVYEGGQAIVGNVEQAGGGPSNSEVQPHAQIPMQLSPRCGAKTRSGKPCQSPAMPNGRCRMHGGPSPGAPKGNKNRWVHGRYSAEAIENRRAVAELMRRARALADLV